MSDAQNPRPSEVVSAAMDAGQAARSGGGGTLSVVPVLPRRRGGVLRWLLFLALVISLGFNFLLVATVPGCLSSETALEEHAYSGKTTAHNKIAVVKIEGIIMEGLLGYAHRQIDRAAADSNVKAVVLLVNSPGGTITASDDLHRRLIELRDGNAQKHTDPKPLVVSMASLAASGGYYIAMPAKVLLAERTSITGSIGVYAAFPNVAELADKYGVKLNVIKAGKVKDSGSMFHKMTPEERQLWQDMVDHAYSEFLAVVEEGRPALKGKLLEPVLKKRIAKEAGPGGDGTAGTVEFGRQRADGGIFTSDQALQLGLIDKIGYLDDAIKEAKQLANLGEDVRVITYDRPPTMLSLLIGSEAAGTADGRLDPNRLAAGAVPRLWYLAPQCEVAGFLSAIGRVGR